MRIKKMPWTVDQGCEIKEECMGGASEGQWHN